MLTNLISRAAVFTFVVFFCYWVIRRFCDCFVFEGDEWIYPFLHWINLSSGPIILLILLAGFIYLFLIFWKRTLNYIVEIIDSISEIYKDDISFIELSSDIKEAEHLLNSIKVEIERNRKAVKDAEAKKNDLIVYLAHDLKTPLASVLGYLFLLKSEKSISREAQERYIDISYQKAERLEDLINEFFEITRYSISNVQLNKKEVNITRLIEQVTYEFDVALKGKNLQFELILEKNLWICCDPSKIERVFDNIIKNAINYCYENSSIKIVLVKKDVYIEIVFINNGATLSMEQISRIFEQFYRIDSSRNTKCGGAGLGLAIAKEIIEAHNGIISASSQEEKFTIKVSLPM